MSSLMLGAWITMRRSKPKPLPNDVLQVTVVPGCCVKNPPTDVKRDMTQSSLLADLLFLSATTCSACARPYVSTKNGPLAATHARYVRTRHEIRTRIANLLSPRHGT